MRGILRPDTIRMIAVDLDGTLLRTDKTVSSYTVETLRKARARGIRLVFASARPIRTLRPYLTQVACDAAICHNGAVTIMGGDICKERWRIPFGEAARILQLLQRKGPRRLAVEIDDRIYANFDVLEIWGTTPTETAILKASFVPTDFSDLPRKDADKILAEMEGEADYQALFPAFGTSIRAVLTDGGRLCQIMNEGATKMNALRSLAEIWQIPIGGIAAFGDDRNDLEMLSECGFGVAMANAADDVREAACAVTETNDNDGVASYIERRLLA